MKATSALREFLGSRPLLARALGNTGWLLGEEVPRKLGSIFVGVWIARYLGPAQFGLLSFAYTWVLFFTLAGAMGLMSVVIRDLAAHPEQRDEILGTATALRAASSGLVVAGCIGTVGLARPDAPILRVMVAILSLASISQSLETVDWYFRSGLAAGKGVVPRTVVFVAISALRVGLLIGKAPLLWFAVAAAAETLLSSLGMALVYRLRVGRFGAWKFSAGRARDLLRNSWPLFFTGLAITLYARIDIVMLGAMSTDKNVGLYSAAEAMGESWLFIPMAISATMLPVLVDGRKQSEELFEAHVDRFYRFLAGVGYLVVIPGSIFGPFLIRLLLGDAYYASAPMFVAILWSGVLICLGVARSAHWVALNWTRQYMASTVAGAVVNIAANLLLIPRYGAWGAIAATLICQWIAVQGFCLLFAQTRPTGMRMFRALLSPTLW